jgi:hypothetical protein
LISRFGRFPEEHGNIGFAQLRTTPKSNPGVVDFFVSGGSTGRQTAGPG